MCASREPGDSTRRLAHATCQDCRRIGDERAELREQGWVEADFRAAPELGHVGLDEHQAELFQREVDRQLGRAAATA